MITPGMGTGDLNAGNYLDVPQHPLMRRRSTSDLEFNRMARGLDSQVGNIGFGTGTGHSGAYGGGTSYGGGNSGETRYDGNYGSRTPYSTTGVLDYERSGRGYFSGPTGAAFTGAGGMMSAPGGASFGMGVGGFAPSSELLTPGGLENRNHTLHPRLLSRHLSYRRQGSAEREMPGAGFSQGIGGGGYRGNGGFGAGFAA